MLIAMRPDATDDHLRAVAAALSAIGRRSEVHTGERRTIIDAAGPIPADAEAVERIARMPGVESVHAAAKNLRPAPLYARARMPGGTAVKVGPVRIAEDTFTIIAGPCAIESTEQALATARAVAAAGAAMLRGGAYKPRTSPYAFQGLGLEGLDILDNARDATGLPVVTEAMEPAAVAKVAAVADVVQIGSRNMQNTPLLRAAGKARKPVLLKRGFAATVDELLEAAEYILAEGNPDVILCERGIRTFAQHHRNTLDLSVIPVLKERTHLPVIVDPSHASGRAEHVLPLARAAAAVGADGLMVEVHVDPAHALSDGHQSLTPEAFAELVAAVTPIAESLGRRLSRAARPASV